MGKGALVFKGDEHKAKKKKKKSKHVSDTSIQGDRISTDAPSSSLLSSNSTARLGDVDNASATHSHSQQALTQPKIQAGKGQITTSGTVVTGHNGTEFLRQLRVGDAVLVGGEMRVVTMCLSDISINLSSAFSTNYVQPTNFQYISKPRPKKSQSEINKRQLQEEEEQAKSAAGTYASNNELVYREKTEQGSYRIVKKSLDHGATRGDLLEMRTKKKSDKYC